MKIRTNSNEEVCHVPNALKMLSYNMILLTNPHIRHYCYHINHVNTMHDYQWMVAAVSDPIIFKYGH